MENALVENSELGQVGDNSMKVTEYCLLLPTILRQILEHFSTQELIELSLVSKLWNFEARSLMRYRGNLRANCIRSGNPEEDSCLKLVAFASDLEKMRVVPFSGLSFPIFHRFECESVSMGSLLPSYKLILDRLPWKHFSVGFHDEWEDCEGCPALLLVDRILDEYCGNLEELFVGIENDDIPQNAFQDRNFPRLKILTLKKKAFCIQDEHWTNEVLKTLVACAPNLQELRVQGDFNFIENILEGSSAVLVSLGGFRPLVHQVSGSLVGSFTAEQMEILLLEEGVDPESLNSCIPKLLEASRTSLKTLRMDLLFAVPLMCYGICLENVTTLQIHMNCCTLEFLEPSFLELLLGLDFTRVFPKLSQVAILDAHLQCFASGKVSAFVQQGTEMLSSALPDRSIKIKVLDFEGCGVIEDCTLQLLGRMFPEITTVHTNDEHAAIRYFGFPGTFPKLVETD